MANINAAAGYYGIEPADVQYSVVVFYAGYTSFFSLERRFFRYLATKEYFFIFTLIQILTSFGCYQVQSLPLLLLLRFIQGMCLTSTANLALALIYNRLKTERAREIGYSVYFGMLICILPFNNFITADLIDSFNFNVLYKGAMYSYIPSLILLSVIMNNIRLDIKFPLYLLDWASFILYAIFLSLLGYVLVYGQEYYWFQDNRILYSTLGAASSLLLFLLRQFVLKRPYFDLEVFKYRNFKIGALILFILYICRFASGLTSAYFSNVLGLDPIHISYINLFNILGIIIGVITSCVMVLQKRRARLIWIYGFCLLLLYHVGMFFLLNIQANENIFYLPLIIQGLGVGMLMTPTIIFMISSAPVRFGATAAGICLFVRCFGFYASIALMNFYELFSKSKHYNTFQDQLTQLNPVTSVALSKQTQALVHHGANADKAIKVAQKLLVKSIGVQGQIRYAMDYYEMISWMLVFTITLVALFPYINRTVIYLRSDQPAPF
ncbi:MFS transporter [Pedobacter steynii]